MSTTLQQQIQEKIQEIVQLERVTKQLETTRYELDEAIKELADLDQQLSRELTDIEKLEGLSTKAIFYKILGSKEQQLEKERQDFLELSLKEEDLKKSIKILEYEINILQVKINSGTDLKKKLEILKRQREEEIINSEPDLRNELLQISNNLERTYQFKNELEEAIEVGSTCHSLTQQITAQLSKVRNWGQWPSGRRRKRMSRNIQKDAIDRSRHLAYQLKHHLNLFEKELADIGKQITFNSDTTKFTQFSDFFFNNLITDWIMQQQLAEAISSATILYNHLVNCLEELKIKKDIVVDEISKLNNKRDQILTS